MAGLPISIGSVGVRIVPDMRGFVEEISAYSKTIPDIRIGVDVDDAAAEIQLVALQAQVDRLSGESVHINVDVDGAGTATIGSLGASVDDLTTSLGGAGIGAESAGAAAASGAGGFSLLGAAILGVIVLAGPITAVLVPALFGLGAVIASVTAGLGVFAVAFVPLAKAVAAFRKAQLDPTQANLDALRKSLMGMPGAGRGLVLFIGTKLWPAFQKIQRAAERGLFPGLLKGLKALMPLVQPFTRFVGALARTMGDLFAQAGKALNDKFWRGFFSFVTATAGPTLETFAKILGNVAHGIAAMFEGLGPVTKSIGDALLSLSKSFANWASGKGFQDFLAYVKENGPPFAHLLGQMVVLVVNLLKAFAPLGPVVVKITSAVAGFLNSLNPTELLAIVAVVGGLAGGFFGIGIAVAAVAAIIIRHWSGIKGFFEGIGRWFAGPFVDFFTSMGSKIKGAAEAVGRFFASIWGGIKSAAASVGRWFSGPFVGFFESMGSKIKSAWDRVVSFFKSIPGKIKGFFDGARDWLVDAGKAILEGLLDGLKSAWHHVTGFVSGIGGWIKGHKGPIEVDRVMLVPHGQAIMQGLADGMRHKWPSVKDVVHAAGKSIPEQMAAGIDEATPKMTASMSNLSKALDKELTNLKSQLSSLQSGKSSLASSIRSALGGFDLSAAGTQSGGSSGYKFGTPLRDPNTGQLMFGGILPVNDSGTSSITGSGIQSYLDKFLHDEQRVIDLVHKLQGKLPAGFLAQLESEPASESLPILKALAQATPSQIRDIRGDLREIHQAASRAGHGAAREVFDPQIGDLKKEIRGVKDEIHELRTHIGGDVAGAMNGVHATAQHKGKARAAR